MEIINKEYPEFGFNVRYGVISKEDKLDCDVTWQVTNEKGEILMLGDFYSKDFFQSKISVMNAKLEENVYESLFYLYFENIKLECIALVEDKDIEDIEEEM